MDIREAQAGGWEALRNLVLRLQDPVLAYAFSLLGDYHLAQDAAQEALVSMVRNLGQLREPAAFVGWLRTIVFKHCDRIRRRRHAELVFPEDDSLIDDRETPASPDRTADAPAIYSLFEAEDHPSRREWRAGRLSDSHAEWRVSRAAFIRENGAERLVGAVNAYDLTLRIGSAQVRACGFNGEVLGSDFGNREDVLAPAYMDAVGAMRESGYDMAVTFDDEAFWLDSGFTLGWRALVWRVATSDLPSGPTPDLERIEAVHRDDLAAAFNDSHATLTGTVRRPTYRRNKHPGLFIAHAWNGQGDKGGSRPVSRAMTQNAGIRCEHRPTSLVCTFRVRTSSAIRCACERQNASKSSAKFPSGRCTLGYASVVMSKRRIRTVGDNAFDGGKQQIGDRLAGSTLAGQGKQGLAHGHVS